MPKSCAASWPLIEADLDSIGAASQSSGPSGLLLNPIDHGEPGQSPSLAGVRRNFAADCCVRHCLSQIMVVANIHLAPKLSLCT